MKRVALKRRTPLPRGKSLGRGKAELRRRTRMAPINRSRRATLRERQYGPEGFADWLRSLGCVVGGCEDDRIEVAHVKSRGAGGDWTSTVPLCHGHHASLHALGTATFQRRHRLDLADLAAAHVLRWRQFAGNGPLHLAHPVRSEEQAAERGVVSRPAVQDATQRNPDSLHLSPSADGSAR